MGPSARADGGAAADPRRRPHGEETMFRSSRFPPYSMPSWGMTTTASDALFPGKHFISTVLEALDTKTRMTGALAQRYLMRAAMAGMIVGVFFVVN